jgi:hypothetical protein
MGSRSSVTRQAVPKVNGELYRVTVLWSMLCFRIDDSSRCFALG